MMEKREALVLYLETETDSAKTKQSSKDFEAMWTNGSTRGTCTASRVTEVHEKVREKSDGKRKERATPTCATWGQGKSIKTG